VSASKQIIDSLVASGMDASEAGVLLARVIIEMSVTHKSANAMRQQRFRDRNKPLQSVTPLREDDTLLNVTNRNEALRNNACKVMPLSKDSKKVRERQSRGTRVTADWTPSLGERSFAKQEGFGEPEIDREANKFRDYWTACAGAKGVKLDWSATWRQWIRNGAERSGKVRQPDPSQPLANQFYAVSGSDQLMAWDYHQLTLTGKPNPRDKKGGWYFQTEWPPGHGRLPLEQPNGATK
jgi:hypothetical protein